MKNKLLILVLFLSYFPSRFYHLPKEISLSIFYEYKLSLDWFLILYISAIQFMALAYCLWKPYGINKVLKKSIFILTVLDFLHLVLYAKQGLENTKILIIILIISIVHVFSKYRKTVI